MSKSIKPLRSIVTGGSGVLGQAILKALYERGDKTVNLDKQSDQSDAWIEMNLQDSASVSGSVEAAIERLGGVDILIHAAGVFQARKFLDLDEQQFFNILDTNLMGSFRVAQAVTRHMSSEGGRILFISSIHAQRGVEGRMAYGASKAGIEAITRVMAAELSYTGVRVNALAPGAIDGGMGISNGKRSGWDKVTPARRRVTASEVADLAVMLTGDAASFVSGQVICQDGGVSAAQMLQGS